MLHYSTVYILLHLYYTILYYLTIEIVFDYIVLDCIVVCSILLTIDILYNHKRCLIVLLYPCLQVMLLYSPWSHLGSSSACASKISPLVTQPWPATKASVNPSAQAVQRLGSWESNRKSPCFNGNMLEITNKSQGYSWNENFGKSPTSCDMWVYLKIEDTQEINSGAIPNSLKASAFMP